MVEVPRTHSAKLLLLHLVMVGVPTNTFAMDENNPRRRPGVQAAEFNLRSPRWSPRRSTDLESRPEPFTSRMDAEHTREVRV